MRALRGHREEGAALLAVLLLVAFIATLAMRAFERLAMQFGGRLSVEQAAGIIRSRPARWWESVEKFTADRLGGLGNVTGLNPPLDVRKRWFALDLDVTVDGAQVRERALIDAGIPPPRVVMQQWGAE